MDEGCQNGRNLLLLRPWEFGGRFKQAAHPASRSGASASLLLSLAQQFIHRNTQRPRHRRRQPRWNVARLAFIERERAFTPETALPFAAASRCASPLPKGPEFLATPKRRFPLLFICPAFFGLHVLFFAHGFSERKSTP